MIIIITALFGVVGFMGLKMAYDYWQDGSPSKRFGAILVGLLGLVFGGAALFFAVAAAIAQLK